MLCSTGRHVVMLFMIYIFSVLFKPPIQNNWLPDVFHSAVSIALKVNDAIVFL